MGFVDNKKKEYYQIDPLKLRYVWNCWALVDLNEASENLLLDKFELS